MVANVPDRVTLEDLCNAWACYLPGLNMINRPESYGKPGSKHQGYAFLTFATPADAKTFQWERHGTFLGGESKRPLNVTSAKFQSIPDLVNVPARRRNARFFYRGKLVQADSVTENVKHGRSWCHGL